MVSQYIVMSVWPSDGEQLASISFSEPVDGEDRARLRAANERRFQPSRVRVFLLPAEEFKP